MQRTARDIMTSKFHTLTPTTPVAEAVKLFKTAAELEGRKVFGMMVIDDSGQLAGMISMYDILLFMRPKHIHIWGRMEDIDMAGIIEKAFDKTRSILVGDIMTPDIITVAPQTHILMVLDLMIKKHVRRLPVVEEEKILGIVYISDLFYNFLDRFTE
ncbi:CBS domain-containing protein [Desulfospira joergensenii]|uniref:CBS domain-containing protein n=1 Tax=Desulfospira joergensenii TaxID=53329 RepID=UPI0003B584B8|nr:CBS domain-containing protein [Desulfospira joergensenii]